jgi:hypothetical protein
MRYPFGSGAGISVLIRVGHQHLGGLSQKVRQLWDGRRDPPSLILGASLRSEPGAVPMLLDLLHGLYRRTYGMEKEAAVKLIRALIEAGFVADDQRADLAIEKAALEAGLSREQLKAALKYAKQQKWIAEANKAAWSVITQAGIDAVHRA